MNSLVPAERIESNILLIRGQKVMLDRDLAELYGVQTKSLNLSVKRNLDRFPEDFMFQLSEEEHKTLRFQFETSKRGGRRYLPYAFTEHGILMLSSVLNSKRAIQVNIQIMRAFTKLRKILASHEEIRKKLEAIEKIIEEHDAQFKAVFTVLQNLMTQPAPAKEKKVMGFVRRSSKE